MKFIKFLLTGVFFGIVLVKSEAVSWYRIFEMFRFQSFHMYGILGSAVVLGIFFVYYLKARRIKSSEGNEIHLEDKSRTFYRYMFGGIIFGLGWALGGACPGPMYILLGTGVYTMVIVIISAMGGTFLYGLLKGVLPH